MGGIVIDPGGPPPPTGPFSVGQRVKVNDPLHPSDPLHGVITSARNEAQFGEFWVYSVQLDLLRFNAGQLTAE